MSDAERASAVAELPPPMIPGNFESVSNKCFIGNQFTATVTEHVDWEWINESKSMRPKWGFVTTKVCTGVRRRVGGGKDGCRAKHGAPFVACMETSVWMDVDSECACAWNQITQSPGCAWAQKQTTQF
eukprot:365943-Chlamydomonas_euryale.AAC.5